MQHKQEAPLVSKERNMSKKNYQYVVDLELSSFPVLKIDSSLSYSVSKISSSLLHNITAASRFFLPDDVYLAVKGFMSEKGIRWAVGSFSRAPLAALPAASFHPIPTCPGTHIDSSF